MVPSGFQLSCISLTRERFKFLPTFRRRPARLCDHAERHQNHISRRNFGTSNGGVPFKGREHLPGNSRSWTPTRGFDGFRRNWLNMFQLNPQRRVLSNNAGSDTCGFCYYEYADIAELPLRSPKALRPGTWFAKRLTKSSAASRPSVCPDTARW